MRIKKIICTAVAVSVLGLSVVGCAGSFSAFNKTSQWSAQIGGKYIGAVVHFIFMTVIPVMPIAMLADWLIFNTLEFWTGSNPVAMGDTYQDTDELGNTLLATRNADGSLSVNIVDANGNEANFKLIEVENGIRAVDANGELIAFHAAQ